MIEKFYQIISPLNNYCGTKSCGKRGFCIAHLPIPDRNPSVRIGLERGSYLEKEHLVRFGDPKTFRSEYAENVWYS